MGDGDDPGRELLVRLDEAVSEALQTQARRADASRSGDEDGAGAGGEGGGEEGVAEVGVDADAGVSHAPERREGDGNDHGGDDDALDEVGCAKVVHALRDVLEHGLIGNR